MGRLRTDSLLRQAQNAFGANQLGDARSLCAQVLELDKRNAGGLELMGKVAFAAGDMEEAAAHVLEFAALRPREPRAHLMLGEILTLQGKYPEAISRFDRALRLKPDHPKGITGKAEAFEKWGKRDKARKVLRPFLDSGAETPQLAIIQARLGLHDGEHEAVLDLVTRHLERGEAKGYALWNLRFLEGRALERMGRCDEAFAAYERANATVPVVFDADAWIEATDQVIEAFSPDRFETLPRTAHGSEVPVFVVGMPRCGSTLVETILDAHPEARGAGELAAMQHIVNSMAMDIGSNLPFPACIEDLEPEDVETLSRSYLDCLARIDAAARRIVDKYLHNYRHLGLIAVLFPQGRIIHCRRDPLDTCVSCWMQPLFPTIHRYAADLKSLGIAYLAYERLMAHWRDVLGIPMLEVRYEALVADPERVTREILDFCGLPWDEGCLHYYEAGRVVQTASYDQVNRPIYSSSVGRALSFEKHLGPLKAALKNQPG